MQNSNEQGRTLLELLAVFVIIILLSTGTFWLYGGIMASNEATSLHDDIMLRGRLEKEGRPSQKKTFSTALPDKTRYGETIHQNQEADGYYYSFAVASIKEDICKELIKMDYTDAYRVTINDVAYGITSAGLIDGTPQCLESNTLAITFQKNTDSEGTYIPRLCHNQDDCPNTRRCVNHLCVDTCESCNEDQVCFQGECVTGGCKKGQCCPDNCCKCDTDNDVCTKCNENFYLSNGKCISCPDHATCSACSDETFTCKENFRKTENGTGCYCPAGYKLDGDTCSPCPAGTYSTANDSSTCTPCPCGTYNNQEAQTSCYPCDEGTYAIDTGNTSCTAATGRDYVDPSDRCQKQTASACNKPNSSRTGQEACSTTDTTCDAGVHKHPDGEGHCVCDTAGTQGDCPSGKVADGNCNCVGCINDGQCGATQCDINNGECCPSDKPYYDATNKNCVACKDTNTGTGRDDGCGASGNNICNAWENTGHGKFGDYCGSCIDDKEMADIDTGCGTNNKNICVNDAPSCQGKPKQANGAPACWHNHSSNEVGTRCVECIFDGHCHALDTNDSKPICNQSTFTCETCPSDKPYPLWNNEKHETATCVQCITDDHCPSGASCNKNTFTCDCPENTSYINPNGVCTLCPTDAIGTNNTTNATSCVCPGGKLHNPHPDHNNCYCPTEKPYWINNTCVICNPGTQDQGCTNGFFCNADGNSCYCPAGKYINSSNQCVDCPVNGVCTSNNITNPCTDHRFAHLSGTSCVQCTSASDCTRGSNASSAICPNDEIWLQGGGGWNIAVNGRAGSEAPICYNNRCEVLVYGGTSSNSCKSGYDNGHSMAYRGRCACTPAFR